MEICNVNNKIKYIKSSTNIGIITNQNIAILVDSGLDESVGKKVSKALKDENIIVKAIINTHSHADHCGGNSYFIRNSDVIVYAPEIESGIINYPIIEPTSFFSGAFPIKQLQNKFLMAPSSKVDYVISKESMIVIEGIELKIHKLPGHSLNQIGISVDDVIFCADSIFSKETISKHKIPFCIDIEKQKLTLDFLKESNYKYYIPSHSDIIENIKEPVEFYLSAINNVEQLILAYISKGDKTTESIFQYICENCDLKIHNINQYYLMCTVCNAFLGYLHDKLLISYYIKNNVIKWCNKI